MRLLRWADAGVKGSVPVCSGDYEPAVQPDSPSSCSSASTFSSNTVNNKAGNGANPGQKRLVERVHASELLVRALG